MKHTILSLCLSLTLSFSLNSCAQYKNEECLIGIDSEIEKLLEEYHAVGLAIAIVKDGETIYSKGFGYRDYENKLPVDEETVFGIGSCSKAFTAAVLGILEGENELRLSDKPNKYISNLNFFNSKMNEEIKIHHLLSHSTNISGRGLDTSSVLFLSDRENTISKVKYFKPLNSLGEQFRYNNTLYSIIGLIGEQITNNTWEENISNYIFEPIGMQNSYTSFSKAQINTNFSLGYAVNNKDQPTKVLPEIIPAKALAGEIYSNVVDMRKWALTWLNKGIYNGEKIIPLKYLEEATKPKQKIADNINYGYGWILKDIQGYKTVEHSGAISGYSSNVVLFPSEKVGIIILTNQTISNLSNKLTDNIIQRLFNIKIDGASQNTRFERTTTIESPSLKTVINKESKPTHNLEKLVGEYFHPGFGTIKVTFQNSTLYAYFPFTKLRLQHQEENIFIDYFTEEIPLLMGNYMQFIFGSNKDGEISQLSINLDEEPVIFKFKK